MLLERYPPYTTCNDYQLMLLLQSGWSLGSEPEIQVATNVSNHLMSGIMKYFGDSGRYGPAVNLFEKLLVRDGEIASLLASAYIGMGMCYSCSARWRPADSFVSQTRKSKLFRSCIGRFKNIHNHTHCYTSKPTCCAKRSAR